jgi:hypothetical protein
MDALWYQLFKLVTSAETGNQRFRDWPSIEPREGSEKKERRGLEGFWTGKKDGEVAGSTFAVVKLGERQRGILNSCGQESDRAQNSGVKV